MPKKEPAVGIGGTLSAILFAVVLILDGANIDVADQMTKGIEALIYALCAVPAISGFITRFFVYSPNSVERIADRQYAAGTPPTAPQPPVPPPAQV